MPVVLLMMIGDDELRLKAIRWSCRVPSCRRLKNRSILPEQRGSTSSREDPPGLTRRIGRRDGCRALVDAHLWLQRDANFSKHLLVVSNPSDRDEAEDFSDWIAGWLRWRPLRFNAGGVAFGLYSCQIGFLEVDFLSGWVRSGGKQPWLDVVVGGLEFHLEVFVPGEHTGVQGKSSCCWSMS